VAIQDNCGNLVDGAVLSVFFSNGDRTEHPPRVDRGVYRGTWTPTNVPSNVSQSAAAINVVVQPAIGQSYTAGGSIVVNGTVRLDLKNVTQITPGGIVNPASSIQGGQISPGEWVAILGQNLAAQESVASAVPFSSNLEGTRVLLAGQSLPLLYVNPNQISAQVPYNLNPNTEHQLQVIRDDTQSQSVPEPVTVSEAQPAIFTANESGLGQGVIFWTTPDGAHVPADADHPVPAGATIEIYSTGLGAVAPGVTPGDVAPADPAVKTTGTVAVLIGGFPATVTFAGLAPGTVGLYQVRAVLPNGVPPGGAVPVLIGAGGHYSQPGVTIAVR
jgi:uncharacterized protein (TIGR03437 family)